MTPALTILTFHALDEARSVISFPPALFGRLVRTLAGNDYRVLPLSEAVARLRDGLPDGERLLSITFDDGYRSVYDLAFPVLRQHGLPATVFLTVGDPDDACGPGTGDAQARLPTMEGRAMLCWGEIREMRAAGFDFGAHTLTHPDLTRLEPAHIEREMLVSKAILEEVLGGAVTGFAYPFGRYNPSALQLARQHFAYAVSDRLGFVNRDDDLHALPRVDAYFLRHPRLVELLTSPLFPTYVRGCSVVRGARRAVRTRTSTHSGVNTHAGAGR